MTHTFTSDRPVGWYHDDHQTSLRGICELPGGMPVSEAGVGEAGRPASLLRRLWRFAAKLPAYLSERRRLPPEGDYLRRDIGLSEREVPQEYWQYYFWDR